MQAAGAAQNGSHHNGQLRTVRVEHVANQVQLPVIPLLHRLPLARVNRLYWRRALKRETLSGERILSGENSRKEVFS
ncbi:hypothetical protein MAFF211471_19630 [Ralstonia solanacearum]|nr:hypothetical protein MAFF211471_19630 [Ralstonia solanacearum]BCM99431.1 hypothetical protein RPSA_19680 [Ralstonia solanacearum]